MKKALTTGLLLFILPLGLFGCSNQSNNSSSESSSSTKTEQSSSTTSSTTNSASTSTTITHAKRAVKVRYEKANFTTTLDREYREEYLYQNVPGTVDSNKVYSWDNLNVSENTKVHVNQKAIATFKDDDDNEYDHEDFYRITLGNQSGKQYWVGDDVLQNDHENDYND
ncbi:hypothetical protein [Lentilactobacillus buchneri]|uniref:Lipoprotein n=1 Tax=Lentilactobacillus buchneri subsp. silagei CD034 TaxID=1071400 RepID=J9W683_LENBU|nr:hypothetical protein [Lentilactobacillus buchneri]MCC6102089.1 hypothetical protein [Lactobacillus sp.]AFR99765.1 hypothetical protein LBUCD034_0671 [Lentilactobacillus buchneri subsp. silagei CD034]MCT3543041.1 hypothetical protein [Lentilactobacillus buchneri]MCT3545210.1 hypothetical protein [Lentilactobacillus buchneri]MCT3553776.1 hypothetical protein [Lentilactobacillus buchneri]